MKNLDELAREVRTVPVFQARDAAADFAALAVAEIDTLRRRIDRLEALAETDGTYISEATG